MIALNVCDKSFIAVGDAFPDSKSISYIDAIQPDDKDIVVGFSPAKLDELLSPGKEK
jgi:hypothetical protein